MTKKKSLKQWLDKLETGHNKKIDLGLTRVKSVYSHLQLDKIAPIIIAVAGTNGKGSTVAILSSICQQAGYKVGEFTSPHILKYNERFKINSQNVKDNQIVKAFEKIEENLNGISLSYFEFSTLAAAIIFKQQKVDVAIMEIGLGGRLDSVNAINSDCAIITTIDIDHTQWLGNNIEDIGFEKAGIMRSNKPVIYGDINCPQSIIGYAKKVNAQLIFANDQAFNSLELNINGQYQQSNAKTAITALKSLKQLSIGENDIVKGLKNIKLYARLQVISHNPELIVDVSHNKQAAKELALWLKQNPVKGKTIAVFAVLKDKNPIDWTEVFIDVIDIWCISTIDNPRAMSLNTLLKALARSATLITSHSSVKKALFAAESMTNPDDRIIVFGSFYTVGAALAD